MRLLLVAADSSWARSLVADLEAYELAPDLVSPSEPGLQEILNDYQVGILDLDDLALKRVDGSGVLRRLRHNGWQGRVIVLKASATLAECIAAFRAGADDFITQPVEGAELARRVDALVRGGASHSPVLRVADLEVDPLHRTVRRANRAISLTAREFALLEFLIRNSGRPLTRACIVRHVWHQPFDGLTNIVDVYIAYLRRKVDDQFAAKLILTERGIGYVLRDPTEPGPS